ncbi:DMT family transporter [Methanolacinia paynteri]|uniref:DMT family transporter n=1 Tax=Methanolacinia paynteri TaxID=230356 RepID=UPI000B2059DC|nr:DMT family transporter [Methanolacinia paynteri]
MYLNSNYFKYIAALLLFGSNGIVASYISLNSNEIVLLRTLTGSLFLLLIFLSLHGEVHVRRYPQDFFYIVISGIAMGISWMFLFEAYNQVGVGIASLAYYCGPVIVMLVSPIIFREKIHISIILGFISVFIGMICVNSPFISDAGLSFGLLCGIMSAVMYAVMLIFNKKATKIQGLENSLFQLSTSFVTVAVFTLITQGIPISIPAESILPLLILGVVNTGFGCYLYFSSIGGLPVQTVAICGYLEPLSAVVLSAIVLGECLSSLQEIGAVLIIGGAAFGELFRNRKLIGDNKAEV